MFPGMSLCQEMATSLQQVSCIFNLHLRCSCHPSLIFYSVCISGTGDGHKKDVDECQGEDELEEHDDYIVVNGVDIHKVMLCAILSILLPGLAISKVLYNHVFKTVTSRSLKNP